MRSSFPVFLLLISLTIAGILPSCAGFEPDMVNPGVILPAQTVVHTGSGEQNYYDMLPMIESQSLTPVKAPADLKLLTLDPGQVFNPGTIGTAAQTLSIIEGKADVMVDESVVRVEPEDAIYIPAGSRFMITNTGTTQFKAVYATSGSKVDKYRPTGSMIARKVSEIVPVDFGDEKMNTRYSITRIFRTSEEPLPLSFDLALATIPGGNQVPSHALECGQTGYVLSGQGTISIACVSHEISAGDLIYIPEKVVQQISATTNLRILLFTEPFYTPELEHAIAGVC